MGQPLGVVDIWSKRWVIISSDHKRSSKTTERDSMTIHRRSSLTAVRRCMAIHKQSSPKKVPGCTVIHKQSMLVPECMTISRAVITDHITRLWRHDGLFVRRQRNERTVVQRKDTWHRNSEEQAPVHTQLQSPNETRTISWCSIQNSWEIRPDSTISWKRTNTAAHSVSQNKLTCTLVGYVYANFFIHNHAIQTNNSVITQGTDADIYFCASAWDEKSETLTSTMGSLASAVFE